MWLCIIDVTNIYIVVGDSLQQKYSCYYNKVLFYEIKRTKFGSNFFLFLIIKAPLLPLHK